MSKDLVFFYNSSQSKSQLKNFVTHSIDGELTTRYALFHPIVDPQLYNYMSDVLIHRTPYIHGYNLLSCTHSPTLHKLLTACCNPNRYRKLSTHQPHCLQDHCSDNKPACQPKLPQKFDPSDVYAAMPCVDYTSAKNRLVARIKGVLLLDQVHIYSFQGSNLLRNMGIERLNVGEISYRMAVYSAVLDAIKMNKSLLWFDDDILVHKTFPSIWKNVQNNKYCSGFWKDPGGILLLGASEWSKKQVWTHIHANHELCYDAFPHTLGSFAFFASKQVLPWIHRWLGLTNLPFDYIYSFIQQKGFPVRVVFD